MAGYNPIDLGTAPDDGTGDTGRDGGTKINTMFDELFTADTAQDTAIGLNTDHRGLVNQHIYWTANGAGTIDASNYVNTTYDNTDFVDLTSAQTVAGVKSFTNSIEVGGADNLFTDISDKGIIYTTEASSHVLVSGTLGVKGGGNTSRFLMGEGTHGNTSKFSHAYVGNIPNALTTTINKFRAEMFYNGTGSVDFTLTENALNANIQTGAVRTGKMAVSKQEASLGGSTGSGIDVVNILEASYDVNGFTPCVYPNITGILCSGGSFFGAGVFQNLRGIYIDSDFWARSSSGVLTGVGIEVEPCRYAANSTKGIWLKGVEDTAGELVFGASSLSRVYSGSDNGLLVLESQAPATTTAFKQMATVNHTSGNLSELYNNTSDLKASIDYEGVHTAAAFVSPYIELGTPTSQDLNANNTGNNEVHDIVWDTAALNIDTDTFTHDETGANPERITVDAAGRYEVIAAVMYTVGSGNTRVNPWLYVRKNDTTDDLRFVGSSYHRGITYQGSGVNTYLRTEVTLAANDFITIRSKLNYIESSTQDVDTQSASTSVIVRRIG